MLFLFFSEAQKKELLQELTDMVLDNLLPAAAWPKSNSLSSMHLYDDKLPTQLIFIRLSCHNRPWLKPTFPAPQAINWFIKPCIMVARHRQKFNFHSSCVSLFSAVYSSRQHRINKKFLKRIWSRGFDCRDQGPYASPPFPGRTFNAASDGRHCERISEIFTQNSHRPPRTAMNHNSVTSCHVELTWSHFPRDLFQGRKFVLAQPKNAALFTAKVVFVVSSDICNHSEDFSYVHGGESWLAFHDYSLNLLQ